MCAHVQTADLVNLVTNAQAKLLEIGCRQQLAASICTSVFGEQAPVALPWSVLVGCALRLRPTQSGKSPKTGRRVCPKLEVTRKRAFVITHSVFTCGKDFQIVSARCPRPAPVSAPRPERSVSNRSQAAVQRRLYVSWLAWSCDDTGCQATPSWQFLNRVQSSD